MEFEWHPDKAESNIKNMTFLSMKRQQYLVIRLQLLSTILTIPCASIDS
jgi:hypothetical protein